MERGTDFALTSDTRRRHAEMRAPVPSERRETEATPPAARVGRVDCRKRCGYVGVLSATAWAVRCEHFNLIEIHHCRVGCGPGIHPL